jgi:hypothetical protein
MEIFWGKISLTGIDPLKLPHHRFLEDMIEPCGQ